MIILDGIVIPTFVDAATVSVFIKVVKYRFKIKIKN
jgi:hypothetical protein